MSNFKNKAKSFLMGAALVPASMLAAGMIAQSGGLTDDEIYSNGFNLSHAMECAYSFNTPDAHKTYFIGATNHGMDSSDTYPYMAHPLVTYPAMLGLGLLAARRRWYEHLRNKYR